MACTDADFAFLRGIVFEQSSNALDSSRDYLFESRLRSVINRTGFETLEGMVAALRKQPDPAIKKSIAETMTVNETSFFRDRGIFDVMREDLLPALIQRRSATRCLRLWSAACSTGQETYSLAMMLCAHFPQLKEWKVEILGTDISSEVIARAQTGRFRRMEVNRGLPAAYLTRYLRRAGNEWEVVPEVKRLCRFQRQNLCNWPTLLEHYDGILLRNVMLYFSMETRRELLRNIHRVLARDGFLILGATEQPELPTHFEPVLAPHACYCKPVAQSAS